MYAGLLAQGKVPNMQLGAIADIDPDKKAKADEPGAPFYDDYLAMIESGDVDAIVTCVPHYLHPEMGIEALKRGMHTLLEKPVGVYTAGARSDRLRRHQAGVTFGVFFNQRTNPLYVDLKALIESGELGALRHTSWIITNWWRPQGYYDQSAWRATWAARAAACW
jgi:predicted dehydrogenase